MVPTITPAGTKRCYGCNEYRRIPARIAPFHSQKCAAIWALNMCEERADGWCAIDREWHADGEYCTQDTAR